MTVPDAWPFEPLVPLAYSVILADPPWRFRNWSAKGEKKNPNQHYACMETDEITSLPVGHLAAGDCFLWLWATWPMFPQALEVMRAWGFTYKGGGSWTKRTRYGKVAFGPGYIFRSATEPFIVGTIGHPKRVSCSVRNHIDAEAREHSRKPDETYLMLETLFPARRRCELFARERRLGWDSWGNEVDKFEAVA